MSSQSLAFAVSCNAITTSWSPPVRIKNWRLDHSQHLRSADSQTQRITLNVFSRENSNAQQIRMHAMFEHAALYLRHISSEKGLLGKAQVHTCFAHLLTNWIHGADLLVPCTSIAKIAAPFFYWNMCLCASKSHTDRRIMPICFASAWGARPIPRIHIFSWPAYMPALLLYDMHKPYQ